MLISYIHIIIIIWIFFYYIIFNVTGYIGEFEIVDDHRSGKVVVNLSGRLNKCGVISPRFDVPINDIEKWTNNLLPSRQFGYAKLNVTINNYVFI